MAKHIAEKTPADIALLSLSAIEYTQRPSNADMTIVINVKTLFNFICSKVEGLMQ